MDLVATAETNYANRFDGWRARSGRAGPVVLSQAPTYNSPQAGRVPANEAAREILARQRGVELTLGIDRIRALVLEENLPDTLAAPLEAPAEGDTGPRAIRTRSD